MAGVVYPQVWLEINGTQIPCISGEASRKSKRACDRFSCTFSAARAAALGMGYDFWADFQATEATLIMATAPGGSDARPMVTGDVDTPEIAWLQGTISVSSRDKSAKMLKTKVQKKYLNQSSSDIFSDIVGMAGLSGAPQSTDGFAGVKYDSDTARLIINKSAWQACDDLAEREGFRWYVDGTTAYFEPDDQSNGSFSIFYQPPTEAQIAAGNVIDLKTRRDMNAARPHKVTVKGWHHKQKQKFEHTEEAGGVGDPVEFEHHHNMRDQSQVESLAKSRLKNATRHDMQVSISMPGDLSCDVRQTLNLSGTGTIYDQSYEIDSVEFEMGWSGFEMKIEARSPKAGRDGGSSSSGSSAGSSSSSSGSSSSPASGGGAAPASSEATTVGPGPGGGNGFGVNGAGGSPLPSGGGAGGGGETIST